MGIVRFRLDDETERVLRDHQISPDARGRQLLEEEARRILLAEAQQRLAAARVTAKAPTADLVRTARRAH